MYIIQPLADNERIISMKKREYMYVYVQYNIIINIIYI